MDVTLLEHPRIRQAVAALVAGGGGCVVYDQGMGGRETMVAAAAELAAIVRGPLTVVESEILHADIIALVSRLQPTVAATAYGPAQAARLAPWPGGVLAVQADVLRDPKVRSAVRELAAAADHLVVARHDDGDALLDGLAGQTYALRVDDFLPADRPESAAGAPRAARGKTWQPLIGGSGRGKNQPLPQATQRLAAEIYAVDQDIAQASPGGAEDKRLHRAGMLQALCIVLEADRPHAVLPPQAETVVATAGRARYELERAVLAHQDKLPGRQTRGGPAPAPDPAFLAEAFEKGWGVVMPNPLAAPQPAGEGAAAAGQPPTRDVQQEQSTLQQQPGQGGVSYG